MLWKFLKMESRCSAMAWAQIWAANVEGRAVPEILCFPTSVSSKILKDKGNWEELEWGSQPLHKTRDWNLATEKRDSKRFSLYVFLVTKFNLNIILFFNQSNFTCVAMNVYTNMLCIMFISITKFKYYLNSILENCKCMNIKE